MIDRLKNRKIKRNLEPTFKFQFKERSEAIEDLGNHIKKLFKSFSEMSSTRSDHGFLMLPTGSGMGKSRFGKDVLPLLKELVKKGIKYF